MPNDIDGCTLRLNGDTGDNIFVFNSSFAIESNGGAGDDTYIYRARQFGRVTISDFGGNNRLYFDQGLTVTAANISRSLLRISFEGTEDALRVSNFTSYRFFFGNTQDSLNHNDFIELANRGFTVFTAANPDPAPDTTKPAAKLVGIRANGTVDIDRFSLGYDLQVKANGGAGRDIFEITRFQRDDVEIRDLSIGNLIQFESGVEIADLEIRRGVYNFVLGTGNIVSVLIGAMQRYWLGDAGEIIDANELRVSLAPTSITLNDQIRLLAEGTNRQAIKVATIQIMNSDDENNLLRGGLELIGDDSRLFELNAEQTEIRLRAGSQLGFEKKITLAVTVISVLNDRVRADLEINLVNINDASLMTEGEIRTQVIFLGDGALSADISSFFSSIDKGDSLNYTVVSGDTDFVRVANDGSILTLTPVAATDTPVSITLTATDGLELGTFTVFVSATQPIAAIELFTLQMSDKGGGFVINGISEFDSSGVSVSTAGDVNGDGLADVIVGAYFVSNDSGVSGAIGASYVVFGKSDGGIVELSDIGNDSGGFVINGAAEYDYSGYSVSAAGDVNGDGLGDVIVGSNEASPNDIYGAGASYVIFGKSDNTSAVELSNIEDGNPAEGFAINGIIEEEDSGSSVSAAGDINGDGLDDVIIGANKAAVNDSYNGASYVVFGKSDSAVVELSDIDDSNGGFVINGADEYDQSGRSVSKAGDVNGDGLDDVIIGASAAGLDNGGVSYVVFGKTDGGIVELSDVDDGGTDAGFAIKGGLITNGMSGASDISVSGVGDVNGDGLDDVVVGAATADPNGDNSGASYVIFGKSDNTTTVELSSIDNNDGGFVVKGVDMSDLSGFSVSGAGDVNGDGLDDLIIGARGADPNGNDSGASYLVFGKADSDAVELSLLELGIGGFAINGVDIGDRSGYSVSEAGDVNGDGFDDLLVGAKDADPNGTGSGASYVIFGGQGVSVSADVGDDGANRLTGDGMANQLIGGAGNDSLIGNGGADVLRGGRGNDVLAISDTDFSSIDGGLGRDTLRFDAPITIDLSVLGSSKIRSIESIDLADDSIDSTFSLNLSDVIAISEQTTLMNPLNIDGTSGDIVNLLGAPNGGIAGSWAMMTDDAAGKDIYSYIAAGDSVLASVLIDDAIMVIL